jgi:YXWGXW repeat-containing protein
MKAYVYCLVAALLGAAVAGGQQRDAPRGRTEAEDGVEVLTRGPVHEAFAETISFDPQPGVIVEKPAPDAIEELPPEQKPEGANVDWIPGYWAWDDERNDFLWVSGIWRSLPPGRQWVSGYWGKSGRGSQWTSGYWADAKASEVEYLPEPPATVEEGPNIAAPSADHIWSPGSWIWNQSRYAWRPGYWVTAQPNWIWTPAHYVWSPRGYVFVDSYYDYSVARRGVVYAPVYFNSNVYSRRGFSYSPLTVINPGVFSSHLFLRPSYGHYYFGDYYGSSYASIGFSPWFSFYSSRYGYDPFYAHQHWHHRHDGQWHRRVEADFAHRRDHEESRPPRTWTAQRDRSQAGVKDDDQSVVVATSLEELAKSKESPIRILPVPREERQQISQRGQEFRKSRSERQQLEAEAADPSTDAPARTTKPVKVKLPRTPIVAQPVDRLGQDDAPPKAIAAPQPDAKVEPKPRRPRDKVESPRAPKAPKVEPRPDRPKVEPRPERPKAEPRPERPKVEPRPERPKAEPRPERPKAEPKGKPNREPSAAPKGGSDDRPKGGSKESPKGEGKNTPRN